MTANYHLGSREVEARHHDGSDESADSLAAWVRSFKSSVEVLHKGEWDWDVNGAYLRLTDKQFDRVVRPNFWVVRVDDTGIFYSVYPDVFARMYKKLGEEVHNDPLAPKAAHG